MWLIPPLLLLCLAAVGGLPVRHGVRAPPEAPEHRRQPLSRRGAAAGSGRAGRHPGSASAANQPQRVGRSRHPTPQRNI